MPNGILEERLEHLLERVNHLESVLDKIHEICGKISDHEEILIGEPGKFGLIHRVNIIWGTYTWILCSLSACMGSVITAGIIFWVQSRMN